MALSRSLTDTLLEKYDHDGALDFAFAYGSGVFKQEGYTKDEKPMLDFIFSVHDAKEWHERNIERNGGEYSMIRLLGASTVSRLQRLSAGVYYNTYAELEDATIKYGVIETERLVKDLLEWNTMYVAGRTHKPLAIQKGNEEIEQVIAANRGFALRAALMNLPEEASESDLYTGIAGLSYLGDTRRGVAEHPDKVRNLVVPHMEAFREIYAPLIEAQRGVSLEDGVVRQPPFDAERTMGYFAALPREVRDRMTLSADIEEMRGSLAETIGSIVSQSSAGMTLKGLVTAGPINGGRYALEKIKKRFRSVGRDDS